MPAVGIAVVRWLCLAAVAPVVVVASFDVVLIDFEQVLRLFEHFEHFEHFGSLAYSYFETSHFGLIVNLVAWKSTVGLCWLLCFYLLVVALVVLVLVLFAELIAFDIAFGLELIEVDSIEKLGIEVGFEG